MTSLTEERAAAASLLTADERNALVDSVKRLFEDNSGEAAVRAAMDTESGYSQSTWHALADLGLLGLIISEENGGTGLGPVELELIMEEVGAALLCGPLLSSTVLAVGLMNAVGHVVSLPDIARGTTIATVAISGSRGGWTERDVELTASNGRLSGLSGFVTDAQSANLILAVARGESGIEIYAVDAGAPGIEIEPLAAFDHTRRLAHVHFTNVSAQRIGSGWSPVEAALDLARIALAGEQAGGARAILQRTVDYARERFQFGRSIGSFQAIKHMAADLLLETESAISAARNAAQQYAVGAPGADSAISLAAFACADAFVKTCADSIQMHGGIGFTWEHPAHLYLRRARADAQLFGSPAFYRERFVQQLGG